MIKKNGLWHYKNMVFMTRNCLTDFLNGRHRSDSQNNRKSGKDDKLHESFKHARNEALVKAGYPKVVPIK